MKPLGEIRRLRKRYNLSQKDLSNRSGVSQSLIAKIETAKVEPTYSKTVKLFQALEELRNKEETKAEDVMTKSVFFIDVEEKVVEVIKEMKQRNISQVPVIKNKQICGLITETIILNKTIEHSGQINNLQIKDIMGDSPPIISKSTGLRTLLELLKDSPTVLVMEKGELKGIVCKSDLLGKIE
jgi:predicted transcriptional regulator